MAKRQPWDKYETAILIDACINVINNKTDKTTAIKTVSEKLRRRAVNNGIVIDSVYRNETGIRMQMNTIMSLIQGQQPGLNNVSKLFYDMIELYRSEYLLFSAILCEANEQTSNKDKQLTFDKLKIADRHVDAVFFHKPEEDNGFLSSWFYSPFEFNNIHYTSAGQYLTHQKCLLFDDNSSAKAVLAENHPENQKNIWIDTKRYSGSVWAGTRQIIAIHGLYAKFCQNEELKSKLLKTNDAFLVECTNEDTIWACGKQLNEPDRSDASKWNGQNILGFSLMEVRRMLNMKDVQK